MADAGHPVTDAAGIIGVIGGFQQCVELLDRVDDWHGHAVVTAKPAALALHTAFLVAAFMSWLAIPSFETVFSELNGRVLAGVDNSSSGIVCDRWDSEVGGVGRAAAMVELCELVLGAGEADLEPFDLTEPALAFCFSDAGDQVVADVGKSCPLGRVRSKE